MLAARKLGHGRGGVFWQTQGSGKRFLMVFFAQKALREVAGPAWVEKPAFDCGPESLPLPHARVA